MQESLPDKKPKRALWVAVLVALVASATYALWYFVYAADAEQVFWETVDNNLQSRSVALTTEIGLKLPDGQAKTLIEDEFELSFAAEEIGARLQQRILVYDEGVAGYYVNPLQLQHFQQLGLSGDLPTAQWHDQASYAYADRDIYVRHQGYTQPARADWQQLNSPYFTLLPWSEQWYAIGSQEGYHRFLMMAVAQNGLLYGNLEDQPRQEIMSDLRRAYKVDFDNVLPLSRNGRSLYQYEVRLDYAAFDAAFVRYFNALTKNPAEHLDLPPPGDRYFAPKDITYTMLIDVASRQVVEVSHPFDLYPFNLDPQTEQLPFLYFVFYDHDFLVAPYASSLVVDTVSNLNVPLEVTTRFAGQNLRLDLRPPADALSPATSGSGSEE